MLTDGFEDSEFFYPYYRLLEEGFDVDVATDGGDPADGKHGYEAEAELAIEEVDAGDYDLLVLPGGRSPERLRIREPRSVEVVRDFDDAEKPIAAICHGAQLLMSADVLRGRKATCYWSIRVDLENAGATFRDEPVVVDDNLVTSRHPADLPDFMRETLRVAQRSEAA